MTTHDSRKPIDLTPSQWFGAQLGMTLWLLLLGIAAGIGIDWKIGGAHALLFLVANLLGFVLWKAQGQFGPARSFGLFTLGCGSLAFAAFLALDAAGHLALLEEPMFGGSLVGWIGVYPFLLVYPLVGLLLWRKYR